MPSKKVMCSSCGIEMNRHAEKLYVGAGLTTSEPVDRELGGVIEEAHTCPGCGLGETQRAK